MSRSTVSSIPGGTRSHPGVAVVLIGCLAAILLGLAATELSAAVVGLVMLLPLFSHVRWVGLRRAIAEPSAVTIIIFFYLSVFAQRGFAIVTSDFADVSFVREAVTSEDLVSTLVLASLGTTAVVEAFHFVRRRSRSDAKTPLPKAAPPLRVALLAALLGAMAIAALAMIIVQYHGIAGATSQFASHSKAASIQARSLALSVWATLAVPAVWCAACAAVDRRTARSARLVLAAVAVTIVVAQLVVFGSRLNALLALMGVWVVLHYSGRAIPVAVVLTAIPLVILVSVPILSQRSGGTHDLTGLSSNERYSRIASYGVLDASLAVRQQPEDIRRKLTDVNRWLDLPGYLVPLWPGKPDFAQRRLDVFVAQDFGNPNQRDTGWPTSYATELWLYGRWPAVLLVSLLTGGLLGALHRNLVGASAGRAPPDSLIWYCFVLTCAFSYYKDGDILMNIIADTRTGVYLGVVMLITGVWSPFGRAAGVVSRRNPGTYPEPWAAGAVPAPARSAVRAIATADGP